MFVDQLKRARVLDSKPSLLLSASMETVERKADRGRRGERFLVSRRGIPLASTTSFSCITFAAVRRNGEQVPFSARVAFEKPTVSLNELQNNDVLARPAAFLACSLYARY